MCCGLHHHGLQLPPPHLRKEQAGPWSFLDHLNSNPLAALLDFKSHCCSPLPSTLSPWWKSSCLALGLLQQPPTCSPSVHSDKDSLIGFYAIINVGFFFLFLSFLPSLPFSSLSLFLSSHYNLRITHNWYPASLIHFLQFSFHLG